MSKKRLLVCTIARDARSHLPRWHSQLVELYQILLREGWQVEISVYENDSTDGTAEWLADLDYIPGPVGSNSYAPILVRSEQLGTAKYSSVWDVTRIRNLAAARNKCLEQMGDLSAFDKIAYIEPDVTYDPHWCAELVLARHPAQAGIEPDIYSGWSLRTKANPKESCFLYDCCATRQTDTDTSWDFTEKGGKWRGESLIKTNLGGVDSMCLHRVWSTFNCFCVYRAKPFIDGHRWTYWNRRINPGSGLVVAHPDGGTAYLEADTVAICEMFRQYDYSNIFLNTNCLIRHR